jgi:hypothetical protein
VSGPLLALGAALIALAVWASRRGGTRARAARLMAGLAPVSPHEALLAGDSHYLAVQGSIDAAEAFDDENHRPLVYRRERVLVHEGGAGGGQTWRELERVVRSVPFSISDSKSSISIDAAALEDGLVVIERQWEGSIAELAAAGRAFRDSTTTELVAHLALSAPQLKARVTLEQISTLDRGTVVGLLRNGALTAGGAGQPLVLTTLDRREALRILGSASRGTLAMSLLTLGALLTGVLITAAGIVGLVGELASAGSTGGVLSSASPDQAATQAANPESGDARNGGVATGPGGLLGLIGALLLPLLVGALIALLARAVARWRSAGSRISE